MDRLERQEKRHSVVITGLNEIVSPGKVKSNMSDLFTDKLGVNVSINDAIQIKLRSGKTKEKVRNLDEPTHKWIQKFSANDITDM